MKTNLLYKDLFSYKSYSVFLIDEEITFWDCILNQRIYSLKKDMECKSITLNYITGHLTVKVDDQMTLEASSKLEIL